MENGQRQFHQRGLRAITLIATLVLIFLPSLELSPQSADDWDWSRHHFPEVLDDLMPVKNPDGGYIAYRSHRSIHTDVLEYSFNIEYNPKEDEHGVVSYVSAHVIMADSVSIYDQMMTMHRSDPKQDAASIEKKIKVKRWDLTEAACPALRPQFTKFQNLRWGAPAFDALAIHPLVHEFHVEALMGTMNLELTDQGDPLVQWALETRRALETCTASRHALK